MIKHQGRRVPSSVQADHASAPAFQPVPPPPAPHLSSCSPLLWWQEQAQLHLQLPQLSRHPATNHSTQSSPSPSAPPHPTPPPASRSQALRVAAGPEGCSWELGTSLVTPTQGHFATFHMDPPVMCVSSGCSKPERCWPHAQPSFAHCPAQGSAAAVPVPVDQDAGFLLGQQSCQAVGLQATAGQRLTLLRLEAGRALEPQARSL